MRTSYSPLFKYKLIWLVILIILMAVSLSIEAKEEAGTENKKSLSGFEPSNHIKNIDTDARPQVDSETKTENKTRTEHNGSKIFPAVWCADITDSETQEICWKAYRSGLKYYEGGLEQRGQVFKWQHVTTRIIFIVVLILVAIGVYFAWAQFKSGEVADKNSELEISLSGIKISSSVLGVIILMISLAFFYLYLRYVYPINELF